MPVIRKLTADEVRAVQENESKSGNSGVRAQVRAEYDSLLSQYAVGDWVELTLDDGEKVLTVKKNVLGAAVRANKGIEFARAPRGKGKQIVRFKIVEVNDPAAATDASVETESE